MGLTRFAMLAVACAAPSEEQKAVALKSVKTKSGHLRPAEKSTVVFVDTSCSYGLNVIAEQDHGQARNEVKIGSTQGVRVSCTKPARAGDNSGVTCTCTNPPQKTPVKVEGDITLFDFQSVSAPRDVPILVLMWKHDGKHAGKAEVIIAEHKEHKHKIGATLGASATPNEKAVLKQAAPYLTIAQAGDDPKPDYFTIVGVCESTSSGHASLGSLKDCAPFSSR